MPSFLVYPLKMRPRYFLSFHSTNLSITLLLLWPKASWLLQLLSSRVQQIRNHVDFQMIYLHIFMSRLQDKMQSLFPKYVIPLQRKFLHSFIVVPLIVLVLHKLHSITSVFSWPKASWLFLLNSIYVPSYDNSSGFRHYSTAMIQLTKLKTNFVS